MEGILKRNSLYVTVILLTLISGISYFQFISDERIYALVGDVASQVIPEMNDLLSIIEERRLPLWSFSKGLGNQMTVGNWTGDPFTWLAFLLGGSNFAYWLGAIAVVKIVLSGVFFHKFLEELKFAPYTRILFSLFYALNGHMVLRGIWVHYATEVVLVALCLWALEKYYNGSNKYFYPITFAVLLCSRSASFIYIYSGLSFAYIIFRRCFDKGVSWKTVWKEVFKFIPIYVLGIALSAVLVLPGIIAILESPRLSGMKVFHNPFSVVDIMALITTFTKSFSYSILGTHNTTGTSGVILEDQVLYCGILCMVLIPQVLSVRSKFKREARTLLVMLALVCVYYVFPFVRWFLNAFATGHYKTSSFWTIIFIILVGAFILDKVEKGEIELSKRNIFSTGLIYCIVFFLIYRFYPDIVRLQSLILVVAFIVIFVLTLTVKTSFCARFKILLGLSCIELIIGTSTITNGNELLNDNADDIYNPQISEAISYLKQIDVSPFYRIVIDSENWMLRNSGQNFNYFGTGAYISVQNKSAAQFYQLFNLKMDALTSLPQFNEREMLNNMLGVKYFVKLIPSSTVPEGFELIYDGADSEFAIYKNSNFLPLGFIYHKAIDDTYISELQNIQKDALVSQSIILNSDDIEKTQSELSYEDFEIFEGEYFSVLSEKLSYVTEYNMTVSENNFPYQFSYTSTLNDPIILFSLGAENGNNSFKIEFDLNSQIDTGGQIYYAGEDGILSDNLITYEIKKGEVHYSFDIASDEPVKYIRLDAGDAEGDYILKNIKVYSYYAPSDAELLKAIELLKEEGFSITFFSDNKIEGNFIAKKDGIAFFSIPYDRGWSILVDGRRKNVMCANGGFLAIPLQEGQHEIQLNYMTPGLREGALISVIAVIILGFLIVKDKNKIWF